MTSARVAAALLERVAAHIGADGFTPDGLMKCPECGGDFGPTMTLREIAETWLPDHLPGAPLLAGACLDCGHITHPTRILIDAEELT